MSFAAEVETGAVLTEKIVNSPVEKKDAKRICPIDGEDWSMASAVIENVLSLR